MELKLVEEIPLEDYQRLREAAGFKSLPDEQAAAGLEKSYAVLSCRDGDRVVAMARLLWDGSYCAYLTDVVTEEEYRGRGIATMLINTMMDKLRSELQKGWHIKVFLLAAPGREGFYRQFGFEERPNDAEGAAMDMWL